MDQPQESRTEKVAIAVTKTEKSAVRAVAILRGTDESNLCRSMPIADIVAEYRRAQSSAAGHEAEADEAAKREAAFQRAQELGKAKRRHAV